MFMVNSWGPTRETRTVSGDPNRYDRQETRSHQNRKYLQTNGVRERLSPTIIEERRKWITSVIWSNARRRCYFRHESLSATLTKGEGKEVTALFFLYIQEETFTRKRLLDFLKNTN